MEVINFKPILRTLLGEVEGIKKARTDYPTVWIDFPTAVYRTTQTPYRNKTDGSEKMTKWDITIELYSLDGLSDVSRELSNKLNAIGFRGSIKDANGEGIVRAILTFNGVIDNETNIVYRP